MLTARGRSLFPRVPSPFRGSNPHDLPRPSLQRRGVELPKIVEVAVVANGIGALPAKKPEVAARVLPRRRIVPTPWVVPRGRATKGTVHSRHRSVWPGNPGPELRGSIELPHVAEVEALKRAEIRLRMQAAHHGFRIIPARRGMIVPWAVGRIERSARLTHPGLRTQRWAGRDCKYDWEPFMTCTFSYTVFTWT
jgi:hypothetical protein